MPRTTDLRITAGTYRGRTLKAPMSSATHPMGAREKMALFNSLISLIGPLEDVSFVLDCYCGSGALGLEALSRGAKKVVFVDNNISALQATKENIATLGLSDRSEVLKSSIENITSTSVSWQKYDLILADPPYDHFPTSLAQLADLLKNQGILVLSHPASVNPASVCPNLTLLSTKTYARANLSFFQNP